MLIARQAGASPARPPRMQMRMAEEMAVQKSTWKWAVRMPSVVFAISSICRMATPKRMPLMPATYQPDEEVDALKQIVEHLEEHLRIEHHDSLFI